MNSDEHASQIAHWVSTETYNKYLRGQEEHGGNVTHKNVLSHLSEELMDGLVYLAVLHEQIQMIKDIANHAFTLDVEEKNKALHGIWNICKWGNEYGHIEEELTGEPQVELFSEYFYTRISKRMIKWLTK